MEWYNNVTHKIIDNKVRQNTAIYLKPVESSQDIVVRTVVGDRFDLLAQQYYGDPGLWWYIAKANSMTFNALDPGLEIIIPIDINNAKSI